MNFNLLTPEELRLIQEGKLPNRSGDIGLMEALDIAATLGGGALAEWTSGMQGIGGLLLGRDLDQITREMEDTKNLAYNPRTYGGQKTLANLGTVMEPVETFFSDLQQGAGDWSYETADQSPAAGATAYTGMEFAPDLVTTAAVGPFFPLVRQLRKIPGEMPDIAHTPPLLLRRPPEYTATRNPDTGTFSNIEQNLLDLKQIAEQTGNTKMTREQIARRLSGMGITQGMFDESGIQWKGGDPVEIDQVLNEVRQLDRNYDLNIKREKQDFRAFWPGFNASMIEDMARAPSVADPRREVIERSLRQWFANEDVGNILEATQGDLDRLGGVLRDYYEGEPNADELAGTVMADVYRDLTATRTPPRPLNTPAGDTVEIANQRMVQWSENPNFANFDSDELVQIQQRLQSILPDQATRTGFIQWVNDLGTGADLDLRIAQELDDLSGTNGSGQAFLDDMWAMFEETAARRADAQLDQMMEPQQPNTLLDIAAEFEEVEPGTFVNDAAIQQGLLGDEPVTALGLTGNPDLLPEDIVRRTEEIFSGQAGDDLTTEFLDELDGIVREAAGNDALSTEMFGIINDAMSGEMPSDLEGLSELLSNTELGADTPEFMRNLQIAVENEMRRTNTPADISPRFSDSDVRDRIMLFGDDINNDIEGFGNIVPDVVIDMLDENAWDRIREDFFDEEYPMASVAEGIEALAGPEAADDFWARMNAEAIRTLRLESDAPVNAQVNIDAEFNQAINALPEDIGQEAIDRRIQQFAEDATTGGDELYNVATQYISAEQWDDIIDSPEYTPFDPVAGMSMGIARLRSPAVAEQFYNALEDRARQLLTQERQSPSNAPARANYGEADIDMLENSFWSGRVQLDEAGQAAFQDLLDNFENSTAQGIRSRLESGQGIQNIMDYVAEQSGETTRDGFYLDVREILEQRIARGQALTVSGPVSKVIPGPDGTSLTIVRTPNGEYRAEKRDANGILQGYEYGRTPQQLQENLTRSQPIGSRVQWGSYVLGKPERFQENLRIVDESVGKSTATGHFSDEGLIAHVRGSGRTLADGTEVYFVDEIQSDAHKYGRRRGYDQSPIVEGQRVSTGTRVKALRDAASKAEIELNQLERMNRRRMTPEQLDEHESNLASAEAAYNEAERAYNEARRAEAIQGNKMPDIPLRDNKWINSSVAQALKAAVDRDQDGIAFANYYVQDQLYLKNARERGISNLSQDEKKSYYDRVKLYQTIYSNAIPDYLKKLGKKYGVEPKLVKMKDKALNQDFKDPETGETIEGGNQYWYLPITPEMKKAIKEIGVPMYGNVDKGLLAPSKDEPLRGLFA